jgi:hypothetical protein
VFKRVGSAVAAMGLLVTPGAYAATRSPIGLRCTAVTTWACGEAKTCERRGGEAEESYSFDLVAMTYQAPHDRGAITEFEIDDGSFMTFVFGGGQRYVHKNADAGDPMTSFCTCRRTICASCGATPATPRTHQQLDPTLAAVSQVITTCQV